MRRQRFTPLRRQRFTPLRDAAREQDRMTAWLARLDLEPSDRAALILLSAALVVCVSLVRRRRLRLAWTLWAMALAGVTFPFFDLHAHTHWRSVAWIPFVSSPIKRSDILANAALYVPCGVLSRLNRLTASRAALAAGALSVVLELSQVFSHTRIASSTDIACNVAGALLGFGLARWRQRAEVAGIPGL